VIELKIDDIGPSANKFYSGMNIHARRRLARDWHNKVMVAVSRQKIRRITSYPICVECECRFGKGARMLDADNLFPTVKLIMDGLRHANVLIEDSPRYVLAVTLIPVKSKDRGNVTLFRMLEKTDEIGDFRLAKLV
jgi:Holliday junction resolvase RusA-like endonuclease